MINFNNLNIFKAGYGSCFLPHSRELLRGRAVDLEQNQPAEVLLIPDLLAENPAEMWGIGRVFHAPQDNSCE